MNTSRPILQTASLVLGLVSILSLGDSTAFAQSTVFTYQGQVNQNGSGAFGNYDLRFALFDAAVEGNQRGAAITNSPVAVSNGLFTVPLDFGAGVLNGDDLWLEIGVRTNSPESTPFTTLFPRQPLTATPYAVRAVNASSFTGAVSDSQLSANIARLNGNQTFSGAVSFVSESNKFAGSFTGNATAVTNLPWQSVLSIGTNYFCNSNAAYVSGATTAMSNGVPINTTAANGVYCRVGNSQVHWTNANGIHWILAPPTEPYFGGSSPNWVITPDTNSPLRTRVWYFDRDPCSERPDTKWSDYDGNIYNNLGNWATNESYTYSAPPFLTNDALYSRDHTGYVNARDWGAVGNGEVDDTAALQSAINYIWTTSATNKSLYIPSGRYKVSGLYIPPDDWGGRIGYGEGGHQIYGAGFGLTILDFSQTTNAIGITLTNNVGVIINGLRLLGPEWVDAQPTHTSTAISIGTYDGWVESGKIKIRDCDLTMWVNGLTASNCWEITICDSTISYVTSYGIQFCGAHATRVEQTDLHGHHNQVLSPTAPYAHAGIAYLRDLGGVSGPGDDATIINCSIDAFTNAIRNEGDVGLGVYSTHIERAGSFYTCTNEGLWTGVVMANVYMLDNDPVIETAYPAQINLNGGSSKASSFITCIPDGNVRPIISITDHTGYGYHPPTIISREPFPTLYNGATKVAYPVTYYLEHGITTNIPVAAPGNKTNLLQFSYGVLTNVMDHY